MEDVPHSSTDQDGPRDVAGHTPPNGGIAQHCNWKSYLLLTSAAYSSLVEEREMGWKCKALDQWYKHRETQTSHHKLEKVGTGVANVSPPPISSFAGSDIGRLCQRYCDHARRILRSTAPQYFGVTPSAYIHLRRQSSSISGPPTFLDLGCAPGGVSKYLVTELRWHGVGISLPVSGGGIAFDASWRQLPVAKSSFQLLDGSVLEDDWQQHEFIKGKKFYFVNGGAVQDYGQREEMASNPHEEPTGKGCGSPVLPWFSLLVPQLRLAAKYVQDGGVIMFVFGRPECASFPILLEKLRPLVRDAIHIMETMHTGKTPVYVLLTGVCAPSVGVMSGTWDELFRSLTEDSRDYWLGNTEESMKLAQSGFLHHRKGLEDVWRKSEEFLRIRRTKAEQLMHDSTDEQVSKRHRSETSGA
uniref:Ribosomal RNA methyltransferase FtsJ domain-containing protein n=1 Tax=Trypanosoma congolense (strain IL3000) TaxID=1068625 RepID=G0UTF0_TRYCI|nr:conserved hypothetical protein [Trypanosoma congolense IL3000]